MLLRLIESNRKSRFCVKIEKNRNRDFPSRFYDFFFANDFRGTNRCGNTMTVADKDKVICRQGWTTTTSDDDIAQTVVHKYDITLQSNLLIIISNFDFCWI